MTRIAFIAVLLTGLFGRVGTAQDATEEYRRLFIEGSTAWESGDFAGAHELFEQAHALLPNARSYRALGLVRFELRNYIGAVEALRRALADERRPLSPRLREDPERVLREAAQYVGQYQVVTETTATLWVNGQSRGLTRLLVLEPGRHELEVRAGGFRTDIRRLEVSGGENETLTIELERERLPIDDTPDPDGHGGELTEEPSSPARPAGIALLISGGVVLASGVIAHLLVRDARDAYSESVDMGGCMPRVNGSVPDTEMRSECLRFQDRWQRSRPWTFVGYGLGAALIATGGVLIGIRGSGEDDEQVVRCGPAGLGLNCRAEF